MEATSPKDLKREDKDKILNFLKKHPVGVLSTVDKRGNPNASTIYFSTDDYLNITFTTKRDTRKYENIKKNKNVMLVTYEAKSQTMVQISGKANVIKDEEEASKIYHGTLHAAKQTGEDIVPPVAKIAAGPYVAFNIDVEKVRIEEYGWGNNFVSNLEAATEPYEESTEDPA